MSRRRLACLQALCLALAVGASAPSAVAQSRITIPPERLTESETGDAAHISINSDASERDRLREMLLEWQRFLQEGNTADANDIITQMRDVLSQDGVTDKEVLLSGLVAMGDEWARTESWELAERAYRAALDIDPGFAPAFLGQADMSLDRDGGFGGHVGMAAGVVQALKSRLGDALGLLGLAANLSFLLVLALAATTGGVGLVVLIKHVGLLRHGVQETLADRVPEGIDRVLGWGLAFLPVILWLSPPWWIIYWLVLLSGYGTKGFRRLAVLALVTIVLLPVGFYGVSVLSSLQQDPVLRAVTAIQRDDVTPANIADIQALARQTGTSQAHFLAGRLQTIARRPDDAIASYNDALAAVGGDVRSIVNRGNIHFRSVDLNQAITEYKLAVDRDRTLALAWRNGSIAHAQSLKADVASDWLATAQRLDRGSVQDWTDAVGADHVVDADLSAGEVIGLVLEGRPDIMSGLKGAIFNPISIAAMLGIGVLLFRFKRGMGTLEASSCEKCGRAFCARCHATGKSSTYCTQCVHLYIKKDGVSPVVRTAKLREVERHLQLTSIAVRLFNLVLPGAGSLYASRFVAGSVLLFVWAGALSALMLPARMVMDPTRLGHADLLVVFWAELVLLVSVYLVALVQSLRHSG